MASDPLRAGQFNDSYPPIVDGVAMVIQNYARWLNKKYGTCWVVTVAAPGGVTDEDPHVLRYRSIPLAGRSPYRIGLPHLDRAFTGRLSRLDLDIVHAHNPFTAGKLALATARERGIAIVATFHTQYREDFRRVVRSRRLAQAIAHSVTGYFRLVDEVWTPSEATVEVLREYGYTGPVAVVPNGSDLEPPDDLSGLRARLQDGYGKNREFLLLYVGQLIWQKDLRLVLEVLERLAADGRRFRMCFVGGGQDMEVMQSIVRRAGLADRVQFAGWVRDRRQLSEYYATADLLLFPSRYDTSSLVQSEAAAFHLPVLFTSGATTAARVRDGENGFLATLDPECWNAKIRALMGSPAALQRAGEGAFREFHRSWESIVDEVQLRYRDIIERHRRAAVPRGR
jgi:1,2-diacylglycerol 3-alpha-glucosyltransferase